MENQSVDIDSSVNEKLLISYHYTAKARNTNEDYRYLHKEVAHKDHYENKERALECKKVLNDTLDQSSSASLPLSDSFINKIESLSIISDKRQSNSAGEFYLANDSLSKQRIIDKLSCENSHWFCLRSLEDLEKNSLIKQVWLENDQLRTEEGQLFLAEPLTLIFDLTDMAPGDIASFNDILQVAPTCNDKPLSDHVRRVFLVNNAMLDGGQITNPDLWRRLGQMPLKDTPGADDIPDSITDEVLLDKKTVENIPANKSLKIIDFSVSDEWYFLLFGGITVNELGEFIFSEGALANLGNDTHLVLKNAPWNSTNFKEDIATALRAGRFEANRQWVMLPDNFMFSREDVSTTELDNMKSQVLKDEAMFSAQDEFVCINSHSINSLQGSIRIKGTYVVKTDMLATLLNGSKQLVITSDLEEKQWLWLFAKLDALAEDERPLLFSNLPPALLLSSEIMLRQEEKLTLLCQDNHSFTYEINPNDTLESLQQVSLNSQNDFTFSLTNSTIMENLINGAPVIIGGLECSPALAASLETLLLPHPYLFIYGNKIYLPDANVTWIRPAEGKVTSSPLINHLLSTPLDSQKEPPPENPVYSLLKPLPRSCQKNYPNTPPWSSDTFEYQFVQQAEAERQLDNSTELMSSHQRSALYAFLAKSYRGNTTVYSYIKAKIAQYYPDKVTYYRSDRSALQQWLAKHPGAKRKDVKDDFWKLARHCSVDVYESINDLYCIDESSLTKLASHLVGVAENDWQATLAYQLGGDLRLAKKQLFFDGVMRSTLRDALIANKALLKPGTVISKTVTSLEKQISLVLARSLTDQDKLQPIEEILVSYFKGGRLPDSYQNLPDALVANQRHSHAREERRLARLTDLIQRNHIVFLQGEAGAGKTFMAKAVASMAGYSGCKVIQLDPNQTQDELFGGQQLKCYTVDNKTDKRSEFHKGPLLEWALSDDPELLLLDEANLAPEGLLSPLVGLTRDRPELHYEGNQYPLTKKHRIIMTGNPDYYAGRHLDKELRSRITTLFYPPLRESVLADSIILPSLHKWPSVQKQQACERIITLFSFFKELVPGDLTTPRDIKDVLAIVHQILSYYPDSLDTLTKEQVNALVRRAFMDSLAGAVTEGYQQRLNSLNLWCNGLYPEDLSVMTSMDQAFEAFVQQLQAQNPDADFLPAPIRQLVYHYWQHLGKGDGGRTALLVEGSTGWGKDFVLGKTIRLWQQQALKSLPNKSFVHINANPSQWPVLLECVEKAMSEGKPIVISELNLIPSQYLERLFNDLLTGHAKQGFRLFATINPSSFEGRETFSPALKSRCTLVRLSALSQQEMQGLVQRLSGITESLSQWLTGHFQQLSTALAAQKSPVKLTLDDLLGTAKYLANKDSYQWPEAFQQQLPLPFLALNRDIRLPALAEERARFALEYAKEQHRLKCEKAINSLLVLPAPMTVKFGDPLSIDYREVTVKPDTEIKQVVHEVKLFMQNRKVNDDITVEGKFSLQNCKANDDKTVKENSVAAAVERQSKGCLYKLSAIKKTSHFKVNRYFLADTYDIGDYRLRLEEVRLGENGELRIYSIDWQEGLLTAVIGWPDSTSWRTYLRDDELSGKIVLTLNDQWQSLPSLTPADQLRAIRCIPETDIQLARCQTSGLLLIKHQKSKCKKVEINFIIAPEQSYFTQLKSADTLIIQDDLCSQRLEKLLDENVFYPKRDTCDAYQALRTIYKIDNIPQRLNALMDWLDTFSSNKNIAGEGEDMFLNTLKEKQGVCTHKAMIFQMLCNYWGIPVRQVRNVSHVFVEVSPDSGNTWRQYQLGGGGKCVKSIAEQNWSEYHLPIISKLRSPINRAPLANRECDEEGAGASSITSTMSREGIISSWKSGIKKIQVGLFHGFLNQKKGGKCKPDDAECPIDDLIHEIEKIFVYNQTLSSMKLMKLKTRLEQTLRNTNDSNTEFIRKLVSKLKYCFTNYDLDNDYLNCLCYLCEINNEIKEVFLGYLQSKTLNNALFKDRVQKMISDLPSFADKISVSDARIDESELAYFVRSLPNSKYLERKLPKVKINRVYTMVPKENSHISLERMAAGLPAFVNQSTRKDSKPVIIDAYSIRQDIYLRIYNYFKNPLNKKTRFWRDILKFEDRYSIRRDDLDVWVLDSFFYWIAKHKPKDNSLWKWVLYKYTICHEQTSPIQNVYIHDRFHSDFFCRVEHTSETIKAQMKEPDAVVIKQADFIVMIDEFLDMVSKDVIYPLPAVPATDTTLETIAMPQATHQGSKCHHSPKASPKVCELEKG